MIKRINLSVRVVQRNTYLGPAIFENEDALDVWVISKDPGAILPHLYDRLDMFMTHSGKMSIVVCRVEYNFTDSRLVRWRQSGKEIFKTRKVVFKHLIAGCSQGELAEHRILRRVRRAERALICGRKVRAALPRRR